MPTFGPVLEVARLMRGFPRPWYIAGGWAIDIFLGRETREHDDIDVAVLRNDQAKLRTHLAAWAFEKVVDGQRLPWPDGEWLDLPVHEVHATSETHPRRVLAERVLRRNVAVPKESGHHTTDRPNRNEDLRWRAVSRSGDCLVVPGQSLRSEGRPGFRSHPPPLARRAASLAETRFGNVPPGPSVDCSALKTYSRTRKYRRFHSTTRPSSA